MMFNHALVRQVRQQRGLTVAQLAELAGVARSYISHIEGGNRQPSPDVVEKLATALGISANALTIDGNDSASAVNSNQEGLAVAHPPQAALQLGDKVVKATRINPPKNNQSPLMYTPALVLSLVNGWLTEIRTSLCHNRKQTRDFQIQGSFKQDGTEISFRCNVTAKNVTLQVSEPTQAHSTILWYARLCVRMPDLYVHESEWGQYTWFTEYSSLAEQLSVVRRATNATSVQLISPQLKELKQFVDSFDPAISFHGDFLEVRMEDSKGG